MPLQNTARVREQVRTGTAPAAAAVLREARWLSLAGVVVGLLNYLYSLGLTHVLPARDYAVFVAGQGVVLVAGTIAATSGAWVLAEALCRAGTDFERARAVWFSTSLNVLLGLVAALLAAVVSYGFAPPRVVVVIAVAAFLVFPAATAYGSLQGDGRLRLLAGARLGETVVKCVAGALLVLAGAGAVGAAAGFLAGSAVVVVAGLLLAGRRLRPVKGAFGMRPLWASAVGVVAVQGLAAVFAAVDQVVVAAVASDPGRAAAYQTATIVARVPLFLAGAVAAAVHGSITGEADGAREVAGAAVRNYLAAALPFAAVLATVPASLLQRVLPAGYAGTATVLPFAAAAGVLLGAIALLATVLQARGLHSRAARALGAGLAFHAAVLPLAHSAAGVTGMAIGAVAGTGTTLVVLLRVTPSRVRRAFLPSLRATTWCAVLMVVLLVIRSWPLGWFAAAVLAGAATCAVVFGGVPLGAPRRYEPRHAVAPGRAGEKASWAADRGWDR
ncbi:oligosaccharide flippase family protein [Kineococcus esterisolvens]|uniref:oligosaccharide flippase family protein n=1 Tax=unclassified Kineococcus TaxID=2621656 RepID=UPI003D7D6243